MAHVNSLCFIFLHGILLIRDFQQLTQLLINALKFDVFAELQKRLSYVAMQRVQIIG